MAEQPTGPNFNMCARSNLEYPASRKLVTDVSSIRHDLVTARAISRLSHGVARLHTSTSPSNHRAFRLKSLRNQEQMRNPEVVVLSQIPKSDEETHAIWSKDVQSGTKRKWSLVKPESSMELDDPGTIRQLPWQQTIQPSTSNYSTSSGRIELGSEDLDIEFDLLDTSDRYSTGSSMLSVTVSDASGSDHSSHASDADEEDVNVNDKVTTITKNDLASCIPLISTKSLRDRIVEVPFYSDTLMYGEESSDGFSSAVKIPRLSTSITAKQLKSVHRSWIRQPNKHGSQKGDCHSTEISKRAKSSRSYKNEYGCRSHTLRGPNSQTQAQSPSKGGLTSRVSASLEELADDEQSDFPAEETMPVGNYRSLTRSMTWSVKTTCRQKRMSGLIDADSDSEDLLTDTCPILTQEFRSGQKKTLRQSLSMDAGSSPAVYMSPTVKKPIVFKSSKLGSVLINDRIPTAPTKSTCRTNTNK